jgi:hypothetical protein
MSGEKYKELKKEIKQKIKKIKDYEISDNKLAVLVFIITAVLGARIGSYLRIFVFNHEEKKRNKEKNYSLIEEPELEEWDLGRARDDESKRDDESLGDDDDRTGMWAPPTVSLFGKKNKSKRNKKVALSAVLGGGLGVGTGFYLRNKFYKGDKKNEKEMKEIQRKDDEGFERLQKKLKESDDDRDWTADAVLRKKIEFEEFDKEYFNQRIIPFKDDEDFKIKSDLGYTRLQEQVDYDRAIWELEKSKKKLKEDKKKTKKKKKWFSRNKDIKKKIGIIKEQIKENEKQSEEFQEIYEDYLDNKEKRLTKRQLLNLLLKGKDKIDIIKLMSEEAGEDENNLKYFTISELEQMLEKYPFWKLQTIYDNQKEEEEHQIHIQELLNSPEEEAEQEVMLFGKKKRKRKRRKKKRK